MAPRNRTKKPSAPSQSASELAVSRRTLLQGAALLGASTLLPRSARAQTVKERGIFDNGPAANPVIDADIIMTAAVIGHAIERLKAGKDCRYDLEVKVGVDLKNSYDVQTKENHEAVEDIGLHHAVVAKINKLLAKSGITGLGTSKVAQMGVSPIYTVGADNRIIGGTGSLHVTDSDRYTPTLPTGLSAELIKLSTEKVGYQGRGAYTGFISGREGGQTGLLTTYRHTIPTDNANGRRWHPTAILPGMGPEVGAGDDKKTWGMIGTKKVQNGPLPDKSGKDTSLKAEGMHFEGPEPTPGTDIVGYTHGMIQAIYDIYWKIETGLAKAKAGIPHEIAVGDKTTKLSSCFPCSVFMEATGYPASSTHLGRGESWSPLYPKTPAATSQDKGFHKANTAWHAYCRAILVAGADCLMKGKALVATSHDGSLALLHTYLGAHTAPLDSANLILDAVTVHESEVKRVGRTIKD